MEEWTDELPYIRNAYYSYPFLDDNLEYVFDHPDEFEDLVSWARKYEYSRSHKGDWKSILKGFVNNWHLESYLISISSMVPINPTFNHLELRYGNTDTDFRIGSCLIEVKHAWNEDFVQDYLRHLKSWKTSNYDNRYLQWAGGKRYIEPKTKNANIIMFYTEVPGKQNKLIWCDTRTWEAWETDVPKLKKWRY